MSVLSLEQIRIGLSSRNERARWQAAIYAGDLVHSNPEAAWSLVLKFGKSASEDVRVAIATCVLEHLLEFHFGKYFPELEAELSNGSSRLADTFKRCWKFGEAREALNSRRWDELMAVIESNRLRYRLPKRVS